MVAAMKSATAKGLITVEPERDVAERIFPDVLDGGSTHADVVNAPFYDRYYRRNRYFFEKILAEWN